MQCLFLPFKHQIGIFQQGIQIVDSSEKMVEVQKVELCKDEQGQPLLGSFQCLQVKKTDNITMVHPGDIIDQVCLVHDCTNGNCSFGQSETTAMIERESITKETYTYVHNTDYKHYLLNKFYLGDSMQYFNIE